MLRRDYLGIQLGLEREPPSMASFRFRHVWRIVQLGNARDQNLSHAHVLMMLHRSPFMFFFQPTQRPWGTWMPPSILSRELHHLLGIAYCFLTGHSTLCCFISQRSRAVFGSAFSLCCCCAECHASTRSRYGETANAADSSGLAEVGAQLAP